ncbi:MAG TPA: M28 family peptidase [Ignavibacteriaceae bacterium]|nr:M28 family peptidase [Ignavibacteriaceae bacterium]
MKSRLLFLLAMFITFTLSFYPQTSVIQQIIDNTNSDSLIHFVAQLSGETPVIINGTQQTILSRNKYEPGNNFAAEFVKEKFESYGLAAYDQQFSSTGRNVYAIKTGTDYPNKKFIICAHYDDMPSGSLAPGADDNGSGTAAVIEAARVLSQFSYPYTLIFAIWDEEEQGLVGSEYYAQQAEAAGDSIMGVINMDMIAWDSNDDNVCNIHTDDVGITFEIYDKMVELNTQYNIGLDIVEVYPQQPYSDHASFLAHGYSAILLIEDDYDFNAYYHTVNDLLQYYDTPYFTKSAQLAIATVASFAMNLNLQIIHTPFTSVDYTNDLELSAVFSTGLNLATGAGSPRLYYRTSTGGSFTDFNEVVGIPVRGDYEYDFTIPGQQLGTIVQYYIAAQDENESVVTTLPAGGSGYNPPGNIPPPEFFQFFVATQTIAFQDTVLNMNNWTPTGTWGTTGSKFVSPPYSITDSPSGSYQNNSNTSITLINGINLSGAIGAKLEFDTQWDIEEGWDYGQVEITTNNGGTWTPLQGLYTSPGSGSFQPNGEPLYDGTQLSWIHESMDISDFSGTPFRIRFQLVTDGSQTRDGWYIDNIVIRMFNAIPVEITSFYAYITGNTVNLNWSTASEINNRGFDVQRKTENSDWVSLEFINGMGTSSKGQTYKYTDNSPASGKSYYRLKQIDFDGAYKIYNALEVNFAPVFSYTLEQNYPNPFNPQTTINFSIAETRPVTLKLFDVLGSEVLTLVNEVKEAGNYSVTFSGNNLSSGIYMYKLNAGNFTSVKKMMLTK